MVTSPHRWGRGLRGDNFIYRGTSSIVHEASKISSTCINRDMYEMYSIMLHYTTVMSSLVRQYNSIG